MPTELSTEVIAVLYATIVTVPVMVIAHYDKKGRK